MALGGLAPELRPCSIKVIGVGGGGSNAVNRMVESSIRGVEFWVVNTDAQALAGTRRGTSGLHIGKAIEAIERLEGEVDTLIVVSNDKLLSIVPANAPLADAFLVADDVLRQGIVGISEIIVKPGLINVDFADVRAVMKDAGAALIGIGTGRGPTRAEDAAVAAISSPLLEVPVLNAKGIVFNIIGGPTMTLAEVDRAAQIIYENVDADANIIFGALVQDGMEDELSITVLATGIASTFVQRVVKAPVDIKPLLPAPPLGRRRAAGRRGMPGSSAE
ncbi:hypothetical protein JL722_11050 [Aureococcus anophagefferens]|nr:hypothetical protein JL722_11050 [Aureococcus anophagefferens]